MIPEGYKLIEYEVYGIKTWYLEDKEGGVWIPLGEVFRNLFMISHFRPNTLNERQEKHTIRLRMSPPRQKLKNIPVEQQPNKVVVFGDLWCVQNIIRTKHPIKKKYDTRWRDILIEEFAAHWGIRVVGFGILTKKFPYYPEKYPIVDQLFIEGEPNKEIWFRCVECEKYYPHTRNFYRATNTTCEKCLGRGFNMAANSYFKIEEILKKRGRK